MSSQDDMADITKPNNVAMATVTKERDVTDEELHPWVSQEHWMEMLEAPSMVKHPRQSAWPQSREVTLETETM